MRGGSRRPGLLASETGSRRQSRLRLHLPGIITTPDGTRQVVLHDLSLRGARVAGSGDLRPGQPVVLQWLGFHALGAVQWIDGQACGLGFARSLPVRDLLETRDLVEQAAAGVVREVVRRNADAFINGRVRL